MSLIVGNCVENNNLKFVELRKYLVSDENNGVNCLAIDNNFENVFVANHNVLKVISMSHVLDFSWNKSIINEFIDQFDHFSIAVSGDIHLLSISGKGFGTKLAVCLQSPNRSQSNSSFIEFFDLKSVYDHKSKSACFTRINLINSNGFVDDMIWHPEISDNNFACHVTDGSIFIISIGDIDSKTATILEYIPSTHNCLSMCWSPKGKQIVITFNGYFSQYKLINGQQVQEYKKILLPNDFHDHSIIAVKWITSSLFVIACYKQVDNEKDMHIIMVSTPTKGSPTFIDFGNICLDNYEVMDSYRVYLLHYENMVICSTNVSSEVSIIGCNSNELSSPNNWCQWMLDDNSRIDLPLDRDGNESYLRGLAIAKGTEKTFKISANEVYGGVMSPILVTYLSTGIVLPYLIIKKNGSFKPIEPSNITKPVMNAIGQNVNVAQTKPHSMQQSAIHANNTGLSAVLSPSAVTALPTPDSIQTSSSIKKQISIPSTVRTNDPQTQQSDNENSLRDITPIKSVKQIQSESKSELTPIPKNLFLDAINEQINEFNKLFSMAKEKFAKVQTKIGDKEEYAKLRMDTRLIEEVLNELKENYHNFSRDTTTLQSSLIELFSLVEEAKSIMNRNVDPRYRYLLRQRALDPITARHMEEIKKVNQYIELQLRELDAKLEQEWLEWLEKRKLKTTAQLTRQHSLSNWELVYKALANNQKIINNLRMNLEKLQSLVPKVSRKNYATINDISKQKPEIESLAQALKKSILKDNDLINEPIINQPVFKVKVISKEKKLKLKEFLENRNNVPIRRSVDFFNDSSRFMSTIELIKEKNQKQNNSNVSNASDSTLSVSNETNSPKSVALEKSTLNTSEEKSNLKKEKPLTLPIQKLDQKLASPSFSFAPNDNSKLNSSIFKPAVRTDDNQLTSKASVVSKPLNLSNVCSKSSKPVSIVKNKTTTEIIRKEQTPPDITTSITTSQQSQTVAASLSKTVSFGDTTIINPAKVITDDSIFKANLSTINESTENSETIFGTNVSALPKFSFDSNNTQPTLSFNLNFPNSYNMFANKEDNNVSTPLTKSKDDLPKYEDISPPSTPQLLGSTQTKKDEEEIIAAKTALSETTSSDQTNSILSKTLSGNFKQNNDSNVHSASDKTAFSTTGQNSNLASILTDKSSDLVSSTIVEKVKSDISTVSSNAVPITVSSINESSNSDPSSASSSTSVFANSVSNQSEQISSVLNEPKAINTPFASNSFTFGNLSSPPNTKAMSSTFNQGLSFGQSSPPTTTSFDTNSLPFGQQSEQALNNLSFCGLGGQPSAENANKNVFGSSFSNPVSQSSPFFKTVSTTQQSSFSAPFSAANNSTVGGFTSGAGVAQTGFGSFQQTSPQQQSGSTVFGGSALFGSAQKPAFGSSPTFGSSPAFGSAPTFGGSPVLGSSAFGSQQTNNSFGSGFGNTTNNSLSFGALASSAQQPNQNVSPFGSQNYNSSANVFAASNQSQGFSFGGSAGTDSFTQRRK